MNSLAFVFPGQGSQSIGMLGALAAEIPVVRETMREASDALGYDVWQLICDGPEDRLNQTEFTQPVLLAADIAVWRAWCQVSTLRPALLAGHSLGEYAALTAAGALGFADAVKLVRERGRIMQDAVPAGTGGMAAILGLDNDVLEELCRTAAADEVVQCANYNAPGQVVIGGHRAAVERACDLARERGAKRVVALAMSVPSHCALMGPAATRFGEVLAEVAVCEPSIPVIHNVDVSTHTPPLEICAALAAQLDHPVRWTETVAAIAARGITTMIECGPGKVLSGLNKRIVRELNCMAINDPDSLTKAMEALANA
ncbi:MAG: ACP S-malonyltransferase [Gammaproteobacteria bacterium]|nr:ACP S-malonyltransferase [Gammaproteobacteria bacterium]